MLSEVIGFKLIVTTCCYVSHQKDSEAEWNRDLGNYHRFVDSESNTVLFPDSVS